MGWYETLAKLYFKYTDRQKFDVCPTLHLPWHAMIWVKHEPYRYDKAVIAMRTEPTQENPLLKKKGIRRAGANNQVKIIPNLTFRFEKTFIGFH